MLDSKKGFTLIEVLIVTSLIVVVSLAISAAFLQGNRIFEKLREVQVKEDVSFFVEIITRDLRNSVEYASDPGTYTERKLTFYTLDENHRKSLGPLGAALIQVTYSYDLNKKEVLREEKLPFERKQSNQNIQSVVLSGIDRIKFSASYDEKDTAKIFPQKVSFEIYYGQNNHPKKIAKDILLPVSYETI